MTNRRPRVRSASDDQLVEMVVMGLVTPNADKAQYGRLLRDAERAVNELRRRRGVTYHSDRCECWDCFVDYDQGDDVEPSAFAPPF